MSLIRRIGRAVGRIAPVIGRAFGPVGAAVGAVAGAALTPRPRPTVAAPVLPAFPTFAAPALPAFPAAAAALPAVLPGVGRAVGFAVGRAGAIARSAMTYCRRHPAWCASIGGTAAVAGLIQQGQLPPIRRRRAKGISGTELRAFKRVSRTLNKWCKVPSPTGPRRKVCR